MNNKKEYLYVGHYYDTDGNYILKIGTTDNPKRRQQQHNKYYADRAVNHPMKQGETFHYDFKHKLSHSNTLKYEKLNIENLREVGCEYIPNDRFCFKEKPEKITIEVRKGWDVNL